MGGENEVCLVLVDGQSATHPRHGLLFPSAIAWLRSCILSSCSTDSHPLSFSFLLFLFIRESAVPSYLPALSVSLAIFPYDPDFGSLVSLTVPWQFLISCAVLHPGPVKIVPDRHDPPWKFGARITLSIIRR